MIALAALAFLAVLVSRLPLGWVTGLLPANVSCGKPGGSIWQGQCGEFSIDAGSGALPIGPVSWSLRAMPLLRARLAGTAQVNGPQLRGHTTFDAGRGRSLRLENLEATAPLDRRLLGMVPANWTGQITVRLPRFAMEDGRLVALQGTVEARDIVAQGPRPDAFGSHVVEFPPPAEPGIFRGALRDLAGPVELGGTLEIRGDLDWELNALVKARPSATEQLARLMEFLGPPDAQGRRAFSAAGDF
jgi:hypothetical protein